LEDFPESRVKALEENADFLMFDYRGKPRILKVPSGELPDELPQDVEFARSTVNGSSVVTAYLDEVAWFRHQSHSVGTVFSDDGSVSVEDDEIYLYPQVFHTTWSAAPGYDQDCGLLDLGGELILWRGTRNEQTGQGTALVLERCVRGVLGTKPRHHENGTYGWFVPDLPVSFLDGELTKDSGTVPLGRTRRWPREGLARVVGEGSAELLHFTGISERDLLMPTALDDDERTRDRGLLRGRFGTEAADHPSGTPVFWQPFRYWDRAMERRTDEGASWAGIHDHPESSYLQLGKRVRGGLWHRLTWEDRFFGGVDLSDNRSARSRNGRRGSESEKAGFLDVLLLARLSSQVPWDSRNVVDLRQSSGASTTGGSLVAPNGGDPKQALYLFDDPDQPNRLGIESDSFEVRVLFVYRGGAFQPMDVPGDRNRADDLVFENTWKRTPRFESLTVEYTSRTSTLYSAPR
jgi:hypothetical protein